MHATPEASLQEMKDWVGFTDADSERLNSLLPLVEPHLEAVIDRFYDEILHHSGSRNVLSGPEQVIRLRRTLIVWLREVFRGPHDDDYASRRRAIGRRHVEVELPERYMFTAMHLVQTELGEILRAELDDPWPAIESIRRICTLDLALMTGTYVSGREALQLDTLRELLVDHLRVLVLLVDHEGRVTSATRGAPKMVPGVKLHQRHWTEALPEGLLKAGRIDAHVKLALESRREVSLPRVDVHSAEGSRSFRVHIVPLTHNLASFLLQVEELTEAVEMESRVRRSEALAQLGSLSAAVAHELRNPLAGISGALQVITRSLPEDAPHRPVLSKVDSEIRRLNDLVTDLLAFARPGSARLEHTPLRPLCDELADGIRAEHPDVAVEVCGDGEAQADGNLVRQILHNLLRNAVDAVDRRGRVRLVINGPTVTVCDSGPGVPPSKRHDIFEPFFTTKVRGTGLGLAISTRNAEAMGAHLELVDGQLAGAAFRLSLPE